MARITGAVATSHVPAIGAAIDLAKTSEPYWQPLFEGYEFSKRWIAERMPDVVVRARHGTGRSRARHVRASALTSPAVMTASSTDRHTSVTRNSSVSNLAEGRTSQ